MKNKVIIDCSLFDSKTSLHETIKEQSEIECYYGNNLDALYDALTSVCKPLTLSFVNVSQGNDSIGQYFDSFIKVLLDASMENENLTITFSY